MQTRESPIRFPRAARGSDRALWRYEGLSAARALLGRDVIRVFGRSLSGEHLVTQIRTECRTAFLVSLHGGSRIKIESPDDGNQKSAGWTPLTVAQIGSVRFGHTDSFRKLWVSHLGHARKYDVKMTERQRGLPR